MKQYLNSLKYFNITNQIACKCVMLTMWTLCTRSSQCSNDKTRLSLEHSKSCWITWIISFCRKTNATSNLNWNWWTWREVHSKVENAVMSFQTCRASAFSVKLLFIDMYREKLPVRTWECTGLPNLRLPVVGGVSLVALALWCDSCEWERNLFRK